MIYLNQSDDRRKDEQIAFHTVIMGDIYRNMDSLQQATECYQYGITFFENAEKKERLSGALFSLGKLEVKQKQYVKAEKTLKRALELEEKQGNIYRQQNICWHLYEISKNTGSTTDALLYLEKYVTLKDSIFNTQTQQQLSDFQVKYETAKKDLEIARKNVVITRQNTQRWALIAGMGVAVIMLALLWYLLHLRRRRNRELAEANATKDKFFSIISHDLKNPALALQNAVQLLLEKSTEWDTDTLQNHYIRLLKATKTQVSLLFNLLNWAQIQTNRMPFNPIPFDIVAELADDMEMIKELARSKEITLHQNMPDAALVNGDSTMICIVIRNLLTNAVKFTPAGGTVKLDVRQSDMRYETSDMRYETSKVSNLKSQIPYLKRTRITISDTGMGMTDEQMRQLFQIGNRHYSRSGTAGETGSGLGLIVCKELIEKHNSVLHVESEAGKGSKFWFEI
jgi:signal transduction histidine kinase